MASKVDGKGQRKRRNYTRVPDRLSQLLHSRLVGGNGNGTPPALVKKEWREGLTHKQIRFVEEYVIDENATRAARAAGYQHTAAAVTGCMLLKKPQISEAVATLRKLISARCGVDADAVLSELMRIGFSDIRNYMRWTKDGRVTFTDSNNLTPEMAAVIQEVRQLENKLGKTLSLKLYNKLDALDMLGRYLGLFDKKDPGESKEPPKPIAFLLKADGNITLNQLEKLPSQGALPDGNGSGA